MRLFESNKGNTDFLLIKSNKFKEDYKFPIERSVNFKIYVTSFKHKYLFIALTQIAKVSIVGFVSTVNIDNKHLETK